MPAWSPDDSEYSPFDDAGEVREGVPAELAVFLHKHDITKTFSIELKRWNNEGYQGRPGILGEFESVLPTYEAVVKMHGPGYYGYDVTWTPKGGKPRSEVYKVPLVGAYYTDMHKKAKIEKEKEEIEEAERQAKLDRAKGAPTAPMGGMDPNRMGREYMKGIVGDIKELTEAFGFTMPGGGAVKAGGLNMDGTAMMFLGMMNMMMKSQENQMNLMVTLLTRDRPAANPMLETVALMKEIFTMRDGIMPAEKSWIQDFVGVLAENIGPIMAMFKAPHPEDTDLYQKMDKGVSETREKAQNDPAFLKALVQHMDRKVGAAMTDKILDGLLRVNRPKGTKEAGKDAPAPEKPASAPAAGQGAQ